MESFGWVELESAIGVKSENSESSEAWAKREVRELWLISVPLEIEDLGFDVHLNHLWGVWSFECFGKQKPLVLTIIPDLIHQLYLTSLLKYLAKILSTWRWC